MAELKTQKTSASVTHFLNQVEDDERRKDCKTLLRMMKSATGARAAMWGASIVGFGSYHYKYASGREGDWFLTGFSPRRGDLTLYIMPGFERYKDLLSRLGKHKTGKSCLYIKRLSDVDMTVLEQLVSESVRHLQEIVDARRG